MDIEEYNRKVISEVTPIKQYYSSNGTCHQTVIQGVQAHREYFGITSNFAIKRGLVRTRNFIKTTYPKDGNS